MPLQLNGSLLYPALKIAKENLFKHVLLLRKGLEAKQDEPAKKHLLELKKLTNEYYVNPQSIMDLHNYTRKILPDYQYSEYKNNRLRDIAQTFFPIKRDENSIVELTRSLRRHIEIDHKKMVLRTDLQINGVSNQLYSLDSIDIMLPTIFSMLLLQSPQPILITGLFYLTRFSLKKDINILFLSKEEYDYINADDIEDLTLKTEIQKWLEIDDSKEDIAQSNPLRICP